MSTPDEMVFGEVAYREPKRLRRPDRNRKYACLAYEVPGPEDMPIFLDQAVADRIERHALSDTSVELGGILLGRECVDDQTGQPFVWISQELEARHYENTQASFTYTHESWEEITRERDKRFPDLDIVGWYHTHPDFGIFLSGHDQFIHNHFFAQPLQVAYVVDPIRQTRGFFVWKGGKLVQVGGYYIVSDRQDRPRLARVVDTLEGIEPEQSEGGAGLTLTPRLEAELMTMLRRTALPGAYGPPDRGQTAAVFTLIGLVAGVFGLALALWIGTLTVQLNRQTGEIEELRKAMADQKRLASLETRQAELDAREEALSAILREVRVGGEPGRFIELYQKAVRERDAALSRAEMTDEVGRDLIAKNRMIENLRASLETQAAKVREQEQQLAKLESDRRTSVERVESKREEKATEPLAVSNALLTPILSAVGALVVGLLLGLYVPRLWGGGRTQGGGVPAPSSEPRNREGTWGDQGIRIEEKG